MTGMVDSDTLPPQPPAARAIWLVAGLVAALIAWACWGEMDIVVAARGRVVPAGQTRGIQAAVSGSVTAILPREGDTVRAGQVLVQLDPTAARAELAGADERLAHARAELARLQAELHGGAVERPAQGSAAELARSDSQEALRRSRTAMFDQRRLELQAGLEARRATLLAAEATLAGVESRLAIAAEKEERARPHAGTVVPRFQYLQWKDDVAQLQKERNTQRGLNQRLAAEVRESEQRLMQLGSERRQDLVQEAAQKQSVVSQLEAERTRLARRLQDAEIRAPHDGFVQKLLVTTTGATVAAGETVLLLVPTSVPLFIEAVVPNDDQGFLAPGQKVDIKFDALPFQRYGRMAGTLSWISPDAELSTNAQLAQLVPSAQLRRLNNGVPQYVFRAKVQPDPASNPQLAVAPGMTVQVDIRTGKRRLVDFLLFPVQAALDDGMRVR